MIDPDEINDLEGAREAIRQLMKLVAGLRRQVDRLEQENKDLRDKLDDAKRAGKRQAGPHSKGAPKVEPKTPGQKPGHVAVNRAVPEKVDRSVRAQLPTHCECGGCIIQDDEKAQYQIDIPRPIPVTVTRFDVAIGHCDICAKRHQGRHPEQTSDALGAAGVQIGPNTLGLASELKHRHGLSYGGFATLLKSLTSGLRFARSAQEADTSRGADEVAANAIDPQKEARRGGLGRGAVLVWAGVRRGRRLECSPGAITQGSRFWVLRRGGEDLFG